MISLCQQEHVKSFVSNGVRSEDATISKAYITCTIQILFCVSTSYPTRKSLREKAYLAIQRHFRQDTGPVDCATSRKKKTYLLNFRENMSTLFRSLVCAQFDSQPDK